MDWSMVIVNGLCWIVALDVGYGLLVEWHKRREIFRRASHRAYLMAISKPLDQFDLAAGS